MSIALMSRVWASDLPSDEKFVALCLADIADDSGRRIYPSQEYIAWKVGKTDRAVRDTIAKLKRRGVLEVIGRHAVKGGATVEYRLVASMLPTRPPFRDTEESSVGGGSLAQEFRKPTSEDPLDPPEDPLSLPECSISLSSSSGTGPEQGRVVSPTFVVEPVTVGYEREVVYRTFEGKYAREDIDEDLDIGYPLKHGGDRPPTTRAALDWVAHLDVSKLLSHKPIAVSPRRLSRGKETRSVNPALRQFSA